MEAVIWGEDSIVLRLQRNLLLNDSSSTALEFLQVITVGYRRYDTHIYCQKNHTYIFSGYIVIRD